MANYVVPPNPGGKASEASLKGKLQGLALETRRAPNGERLRAREGMTPELAKEAIFNVAVEYGCTFVMQELRGLFEREVLEQAWKRICKQERS